MCSHARLTLCVYVSSLISALNLLPRFAPHLLTIVIAAFNCINHLPSLIIYTLPTARLTFCAIHWAQMAADRLKAAHKMNGG